MPRRWRRTRPATSPACARAIAATPSFVARQGRSVPSEATRSRSHVSQYVSVVPVMKPTRSRGSCARAHVLRGTAVGVAQPARRHAERARRRAHLVVADELLGGEVRALADAHDLDEARDDAARPCPLDDGRELVVVFAAEDDGVRLELVEAGGAGRLDAREHAVEPAAARDAPEALGRRASRATR